MLDHFTRFKNEAPILYRSVVILLILEMVGIFIAPAVVPDSWFISSYLGEKARRATQLFLSGQAMLIPDNTTGWKNRPGVERGNWKIDSDGSRSTHAVMLQKQSKRRVLFLGSSMINGGTGVTNSETISAYIEDQNTECLNFGTMLYTLDQSLLAYRNYLNRYKADVVVLGIDELPMVGLQNMFIPFRDHEETNMPFLKPRFEVEGKMLRITSFAPAALASLGETPEVLDVLSKKDFFYYNFETYRHYGFFPLSYGLRSLYIKCMSLANYFKKNPEADLLTEALMREMVSEARKNGASVIFLLLPDRRKSIRNGIERYLPDVQGERLKRLRAKGFTILDSGELFRNSGKAAAEIFQADQKHYKPLANRMIAQALKESIH